jgi:hypothetical protein
MDLNKSQTLLFIQAPTLFLPGSAHAPHAPLRRPIPATSRAPLISDSAPPHCADTTCRAARARLSRAVAALPALSPAGRDQAPLLVTLLPPRVARFS